MVFLDPEPMLLLFTSSASSDAGLYMPRREGPDMTTAPKLRASREAYGVWDGRRSQGSRPGALSPLWGS